jgi:hypothetical protein
MAAHYTVHLARTLFAFAIPTAALGISLVVSAWRERRK